LKDEAVNVLGIVVFARLHPEEETVPVPTLILPIAATIPE
jgi:hypothetical protein